MTRSLQRPVIGQVIRYDGLYRPHWEIGHIAVRVSRARKLFAIAVCAVVLLVANRLEFTDSDHTCVLAGVLMLLGAIPSEELWSPRFPRGFEHDLEDGNSFIEFEGVVTARGRYGHKGIMQRRVDILRVLRFEPRRKKRSPR
jgi:hypothetical protein